MPAPAAVVVIALDRWGRLLLAGRPPNGPWAPPRGTLAPGESPDEAALRVFEGATGVLIDGLRRDPAASGPARHVYYADPDLDLDGLNAPAGWRLRYIAPGSLEGEQVDAAAAELLDAFVHGSAYRTLFH